MAVIKEGYIVAPSSDTIATIADLDSVTIEPGMYIALGSKTINGYTANRWTVICVSSEEATSPTCFSQIWIPADTSGVSTGNQTIFIRTLASGGSGYNAFSTLVNVDYLASHAFVNNTGVPAELYVQDTQPAVQSGKTIVWIDTSS